MTQMCEQTQSALSIRSCSATYAPAPKLSANDIIQQSVKISSKIITNHENIYLILKKTYFYICEHLLQTQTYCFL